MIPRDYSRAIEQRLGNTLRLILREMHRETGIDVMAPEEAA